METMYAMPICIPHQLVFFGLVASLGRFNANEQKFGVQKMVMINSRARTLAFSMRVSQSVRFEIKYSKLNI